MLIALGIILFVLLVVVHELGHMLVAKKSGVVVEEFGIGFPPHAKTLTKKNGTIYTLNWLPIGGFVRLKGEHDAATEVGSFGAAPFYKKVLIIFAGVAMNWIAAIVIFTIIALIGMPQLIDHQFQIKSDAKITRQEVFISYVEPASPAAKIGLLQGDRIVKINDVEITRADQLHEVTTKFAGKDVRVVSRRDHKDKIQTVHLRNDSAHGNIGISPGESTLVRSTWSAPVVGVGSTAQFTVFTFKGLFSALNSLAHGQGHQASQSVTGPVGIVVTLNDLAKQGLVFVLFLIGIISVSLAVMNILPIPALDGGRLFVMSIYKLLKRPLTKEVEEKIHGTGMVALLLLAALITVIDIKRFF